MDSLNLNELLQLDLPSFAEVPKPLIFIVFLMLSIIFGRYTPGLVKVVMNRAAPHQVADIYQSLVEPIQGCFRLAGTLILIGLSLTWLEDDYASLYEFLKPFSDLAVIASVAWLASRLFRQMVRAYGIELLRKLGREVDELLLVFETFANILIGFIAVLAFAQSQQFNLVGLLASVGIGGIAIAFAAKQVLEQLLGTIVLYLDRPFVPGDYIRLSNGQLGRIESIGLRSTKVRTSAKSTLFIVPNSNLTGMEIENVTRAKKVMVMLYLDFDRNLSEQDGALVKQVIAESTNSVFGVDPGSTSVSLTAEQNGTHEAKSQARVTFFILGSSDNSIELRKRLLELASETITRKLAGFGIQFQMQDPTIYVESPVTI